MTRSWRCDHDRLDCLPSLNSVRGTNTVFLSLNFCMRHTSTIFFLWTFRIPERERSRGYYTRVENGHGQSDCSRRPLADEKGMNLMWYRKTQTMRSKVEEKWFWNCNMKFSKTSQKLHFGVTKKDPCLVFHFHVKNLFKCWSNLGLTEFEITKIN